MVADKKQRKIDPGLQRTIEGIGPTTTIKPYKTDKLGRRIPEIGMPPRSTFTGVVDDIMEAIFGTQQEQMEYFTPAVGGLFSRGLKEGIRKVPPSFMEKGVPAEVLNAIRQGGGLDEFRRFLRSSGHSPTSIRMLEESLDSLVYGRGRGAVSGYMPMDASIEAKKYTDIVDDLFHYGKNIRGPHGFVHARHRKTLGREAADTEDYIKRRVDGLLKAADEARVKGNTTEEMALRKKADLLFEHGVDNEAELERWGSRAIQPSLFRPRDRTRPRDVR